MESLKPVLSNLHLGNGIIEAPNALYNVYNGNNGNILEFLSVFCILFVLGVCGIVINRQNVIILLMSIELMLLSVNMMLLLFSSVFDDVMGELFALFVLTVAAAESAICLSLLVVYYRVRGSIRVDFVNLLRG